MGKRKIEIEKIEDKNKKQVAFSKRRKGLFGKAEKFCKDFGANIGIIVFSPAGKPFIFGEVDAMVDKYLNDESRLSEPVCSSNDQLGEKQNIKQLKKKQKCSEPVEEKQDEGPSIYRIADNLENGPSVHSIASTSGHDVTDDTDWNLGADDIDWNLGADDIDWNLVASLGDHVPTGYGDSYVKSLLPPLVCSNGQLEEQQVLPLIGSNEQLEEKQVEDSYVKSLLPPLVCSNEQLEEQQVLPLIGSNEQLEEKQIEDRCMHTNASITSCDDTDWNTKAPLVIPSDFCSDEHDRYLESFTDDMLSDQNDEYEGLLESFFGDGALADQIDYTFPFPATPLPREIVQC